MFPKLKKMREATPEEKKAVYDYIESISHPVQPSDDLIDWAVKNEYDDISIPVAYNIHFDNPYEEPRDDISNPFRVCQNIHFD